MLNLWYNQRSVLVEIIDLKHGLLSKDLLSRTQQLGGWKHSQSKDKLLKNKFSVYHMELKTLFETSCTSNITSEENVFWSCYFWRFVSRFFSDRLKKLAVHFGLCEFSLHSREGKTKKILFIQSWFSIRTHLAWCLKVNFAFAVLQV